MFRKSNKYPTLTAIIEADAKREKREMDAKKKKEKSKNVKNSPTSILANVESETENGELLSCDKFSEHMQKHYRKEWRRFSSVVKDKYNANKEKLRILDVVIDLKELKSEANKLLVLANEIEIYSKKTIVIDSASSFEAKYSNVFEPFESEFNKLKETNARLTGMGDEELYKQLSCISKIKKENDKVNAKLSKLSVAGAEYEMMFNLLREKHQVITEMLATAEEFINTRKFSVDNEIDSISKIIDKPLKSYYSIKSAVEKGLAMADEKRREMAAARATHGFHAQPSNNQEKEATDTLGSTPTLNKPNG